MTDVSFRELLDSRGGRVEYAFGVAGYPWLVCTSKDLANALNSGTYAALQALTRMLGTVVEANSSGYFATYAEVFPGLETPSKTTWKVDEGRGLSGGDFSIDLTDQTLGINWTHAPAAFEGIEGIHRIAQPVNDPNIGWGYLDENFERSDGTFKIIEQNGSKIKDRVDALGVGEHLLLWINQECVAVNSASLSSGVLTLTVSSSGAARGLFMSGEADHWAEYYADTNPIVSDVPMSIIDKPCFVWAIGLDQEQTGYQLAADPFMEESGTGSWTAGNGATLTKSAASPYEQDYALRITATGTANAAAGQTILTIGDSYRVTAQMRGDGGTGRPRLLHGGNSLWAGTTSTSWQEVDEFFTATATQIYFCNVTGTAADWSELDAVTVTKVTRPLFNGEATEAPRIMVQPQKIMWGKVSTSIKHSKGKTSIRCLSPFTQLDNDITLPQFSGGLARFVFSRSSSSVATAANALTHRASPHLVLHEWDGSAWQTQTIWLCAANSTVDFNTRNDVLDAIEEELSFCENGDAGQVSGGVTLEYAYSIRDGKMAQFQQFGGTAVDHDHLTQISGPCAWLFNLGYPDASAQYVKSILLSGGSSAIFYSDATVGPDNDGAANLVNNTFLMMSVEDGTNTSGRKPGTDLRPRKAWMARYYYSWLWDETDYTGVWDWKPETRNRFPIAGAKLYMRKDTDLDGISNGEEVTLGSPDDYRHVPRFCKSGVSSKSTSADGYPYFSTNYLEAVGDSPFVVGTGIFYMPAIEGTFPPVDYSDLDISEMEVAHGDPPEAVKDAQVKFERGSDPWQVGQIYSGKAGTFSGIFRALLGDTGTGYMDISPGQQSTNIVGFRDDGDFNSCIDWADLDDKYDGGIVSGHRWRLDLNTSFNMLELLMEEIKFAGLMPTWEWDDATYQFMMRFRNIGPYNGTTATSEGRILDEDMIEYGTVHTEEQNDTWLYNKLIVEFNCRSGKYRAKIPIEYHSSNAANRSKSKQLKIKSAVSKIKRFGRLPQGKYKTIISHFGNILKSLAVPTPVFKANTSLGSIVNHAVGREMLITDRSGHIPYSHVRGMSETPGLCTELSIDPRRGRCSIKSRIAQDIVYGWAPAAYCQANNSTKDGTVDGESQVTLSCEVHEFSGSNDRPDVMHFKCYDYNRSTGQYLTRNCSCGEYLIQLIRADIPLTATTHTLDYYVRSVSVDGTMVVYSKTAGDYTSFDVTKPWIAIFGTWDSVETCQQAFVYFADQSGFLGAANDPGMRWT